MPLKDGELIGLVNRLRAGWENEVVELKKAECENLEDKTTGTHVFALSNEGNLNGYRFEWLTFRVADARHVVGTTHLFDITLLQELKSHLHQWIGQWLTDHEADEIMHVGKCELPIKVPAARRGVPISRDDHYRASTSKRLVPLSFDEIRRRTISKDRSAEPIPNATLGNLAPAASVLARLWFTERYMSLIPPSNINAWDDVTFLSMARLTRDGLVTLTAFLLAGVETSKIQLTSYLAQTTWQLIGERRANRHFQLPLLLSTTALTKRIRIVQLRPLPLDKLVYREISKYDERGPLEVLYNCIAHRGYTRSSRIIVTDHADLIIFESVGEFFDDGPASDALSELTPWQHRKLFLVEAMTEQNRFDQMGYGIYRWTQDPVLRFFPLSNYRLSNTREMKLKSPGAVIDESDSQLLIVRSDHPLEYVLALDQVQGGTSISEKTVRHLRSDGSIDGRRLFHRITRYIIAATGATADNISYRPHADTQYTPRLTGLRRLQRHADHRDWRALLSAGHSQQQKASKLTNLLTKMRRDGIIDNGGTRTTLWCEPSCARDEGSQFAPPRKRDDDVRSISILTGSKRTRASPPLVSF
ncbi:hypothetical protein KACC15558_34550 [Brevibacterium ammoniilyticum]|uniref:Transcriptional regulator n=1 Tax=Brevibacterium ammoniilyticum TaxID=1046555 RepID=A0ABP9U804_9MICO